MEGLDLDDYEAEVLNSIKRLASESRKRKLEQLQSHIAETEREIIQWLQDEDDLLSEERLKVLANARDVLHNSAIVLKESVPRTKKLQAFCADLIERGDKQHQEWKNELAKVQDDYKKALRANEAESFKLDREVVKKIKAINKECELEVTRKQESYEQLLKMFDCQALIN